MVCNKYNVFLGPKAALIFILRWSINEAMCMCDMQHSCIDGTKKTESWLVEAGFISFNDGMESRPFAGLYV